MPESVKVALNGAHDDRADERGISLGKGLLKRRRHKPGSGKFRAFTSNLSQGCMVVVAVLPIAGLFLGIGAAIAGHSPMHTAGWFIGTLMSNVGSFVFSNLQILFAVAIAIAFTNQAPIAAFTAVVATFIFNGLQDALIVPHYIYPKDPAGHDVPTVDFCNVLYWKKVPASVFAYNAGIYSMSSSVFGGIIVATVVVYLYNKFHAIKLPDVINFFGGTRFVPIITTIVMIPVAIIMCMIWPGIGMLFSLIGIGLGSLSANGNVNAFLFGYIKRCLVPFGVHHAFYAPLWYTSVGGDMTPNLDKIAYIRAAGGYHAVMGVGSQVLSQPMTWDQIFGTILGKYDKNRLMGDQVIWMTLNQVVGKELTLQGLSQHYILTFKTFAQSTLNHPAAYISSGTEYALAFPGVNPGQYEQGDFAPMMFGLPAAGAAMILAAPKQNRKFASSIIGIAAATSFLTGITEPIEFTFLFLSPVLFWVIHALLFGIDFWLVGLLGANVSLTFSGSVIDFVIYGIVPDSLGAKTNCWVCVIVGAIYIPIYFFTFYWWVKHFNLSTPGRGGAIRLFTKKDYLSKKSQTVSKTNEEFSKFDVQAYHVLNTLGGMQNIENFNACTTKLRILTKNVDLVQEDFVKKLMYLGARGVEKKGNYIMAVFGFDSDLIASSMRKIQNKQINLADLKNFVEGGKQDSTMNKNSSPTSSPTAAALSRIVVRSPLQGKVVDLSETKDVAFSQKMIGVGVAIIPTAGEVWAPISGKIKVAFPGGHAYVITHDGIEVMIHLGIDTVNINAGRKPGEKLLAFVPKVKANDNVRVGQELASVDLVYLQANNYRSISPVIAINESLKGCELKLLVGMNSTIKAGEPLFEIVKKK